MRSIQRRLVEKQAELAKHPLFTRLCHEDSMRHLAAFGRDLTFWVLGFQDLLRLNEERVRDPRLRHVARFFRAGDASHDKWFLNDLIKLTGMEPDMRWTFSHHHTPTRDATYALMSEVYKATRDFDRIILLLSLEAAAQVFFPRVARYVGARAVEQGLTFFSSLHVEAEGTHQLTEDQVAEVLQDVPLTEEDKAECLDLLDRIFAAFHQIFDSLDATAVKELMKLEAPTADPGRIIPLAGRN